MTDYNRDDSPEAIRADIERTRAEMGAKIDRIGEKFSPEQLKQQAQESINDMMTDTANRVSSYVRDHQRELSDNLVHTLKHNPVPTALIGLGLGWLLVESFSTSSDEYRYGDRYQRRRRAQYARSADRGYDYRSGRFSNYDPRYGTGYSGSSVQGIDADGYPYEESYYGGYPYSEGYGEYDASYDERAYEEWYGPQGYNGTSEQGANGRHLGESLRDRGRQVRDRADDMAQEAGYKAQEMGESLREGAEETAERARDTLGSAGSQLRDMGEEVGHQAAQAGRMMGHQTARAGRSMGRQAYRAGRSMGQEARVAGRQVGRSLEDNPMTFGILAFGAGLALSLLLPETRVENRAMGRISDQVKESGYEMAQDAAQRAQHVYEEVRPELEQTARKVRDDLQETAREAQHDMQSTLDKAKQEAKSEAEGAKSKAQGEANKLSQTTAQEAGTTSGSISGSQSSTATSSISGSQSSSSSSQSTTGKR